MVTIAPESLDSVDARALFSELDAYLLSLAPLEENFLELPTADAFLVARDEVGGALGCVALRQLTEGDAEVKRMYVRPAARGLGLGRRLLDELTVIARVSGADRLVLEVGARQVVAMALYEALGFAAIPRFGPYADAVNSQCFAKDLTDS